MSVTESSPLLQVPHATDDDPPKLSTFSILVELIGARQLPAYNMEVYCVVQYGSKTIHRTKPFAPTVSRAARLSKALYINRLFGGSGEQILQKSLQNPIWTIQEDSLFAVTTVSKKDLENKKSLVIALWARPRQVKRKSSQLEFVGKVRIPAPSLLENCTEERMELQLVDELGKDISNALGDPSLFAFRCRIASTADLKFVQHWNQNTTTTTNNNSNNNNNNTAHLQQYDNIIWKEADIMPHSDKPRVKLVTELDEHEVQGASLTTAMTGTVTPVLQSGGGGKIQVKPYPDPERPIISQYMTSQMLYTQTILPSQNWVQAGSKGSSLGRLHLEILSAHGLPNVDIGGRVGNETDAFCAAVYGDAMVQTDVIDDELNPHWPCWTQRAFTFHMQHPSQMLYLSVFGFKRNPLHHRPIGRVEINPINLQHNTLYNLEYDLCRLSHATERRSQGKIRVRLRIEVDDERKSLLAALRPPPATYINVIKKKSLHVGRYTACGEYDNEQQFSLPVLQGYIDEIVEGFIRRILYALTDGTRSLVLWRDQVSFGAFGFPLYSMMAFIFGMLLIEYPQLFPALFCFTLAMVFLVQMQQRLNHPSPWRRCFSFNHYLRILVTGRSVPTHRTVEANERKEESIAQDEALKKRIAQDKEFFEKKEAVEREIEELEDVAKVETQSKSLIPVELLAVLGKVQSIVGDVCRICRTVDAIITWEESDLAFLITSVLLVTGVLFLFIPWAFLLHWTARLLVVILFGPQNKLFDVFWYQDQPTDEHRIRQLFSRRMFEARCNQEEAGKLKAFRHVLFGKYSTLVPSIMWTPHQDFPLPISTAHVGASKNPGRKRCGKLPHIVGQQLYGKMIPRPEDAWKRNEEESKKQREAISVALAEAENKETNEELAGAGSNFVPQTRNSSMLLEEGFEITDMFDGEAGFVTNVLSRPPDEGNQELGIEVGPEAQVDEESLRGALMETVSAPVVVEDPIRISERYRLDQQSTIELGFEVTEQLSEEAQCSGQSWRGASMENTSASVAKGPFRILERNRVDQQSTMELGLEVAEQFEEEAQFVGQSWQRASMETIPERAGKGPSSVQGCGVPRRLSSHVKCEESVINVSYGDVESGVRSSTAGLSVKHTSMVEAGNILGAGEHAIGRHGQQEQPSGQGKTAKVVEDKPLVPTGSDGLAPSSQQDKGSDDDPRGLGSRIHPEERTSEGVRKKRKPKRHEGWIVDTEKSFESPGLPTDVDAAESAPSGRSRGLDADEGTDSSNDEPEHIPTIINASEELGFEVLGP